MSFVQRGRSNQSQGSYHAKNVRKELTKTWKVSKHVNPVDSVISPTQQARKYASSVLLGCSPTHRAAKVVNNARRICHILVVIDLHVSSQVLLLQGCHSQGKISGK